MKLNWTFCSVCNGCNLHIRRLVNKTYLSEAAVFRKWKYTRSYSSTVKSVSCWVLNIKIYILWCGDSKATGPQSVWLPCCGLRLLILATPPPPSPHAHHLFKLDLDLSVHFSHLKEHLPCREKTKKRKTINKKREGRGGREKRECDIKFFQSLWERHTSCKKKKDHAATQNRWETGVWCRGRRRRQWTRWNICHDTDEADETHNGDKIIITSQIYAAQTEWMKKSKLIKKSTECFKHWTKGCPYYQEITTLLLINTGAWKSL